MPNPKQPKKPLPKKQQGKLGEQLAKKLLKNKGYRFLTQNYRTKFGEIDLIFSDKAILVFVEVKTRTSFHQGLPEEAVTPRKLATIQRVAQAYMQENDVEDKLARIDVVAVELHGTTPEIRHLVDVTS